MLKISMCIIFLFLFPLILGMLWDENIGMVYKRLLYDVGSIPAYMCANVFFKREV